jgi:hypothetical protein
VDPISQPGLQRVRSAPNNAGLHFAGAGGRRPHTRSLVFGKSLLNQASGYPPTARRPRASPTYIPTYAMRDNTLIGFDYVRTPSSARSAQRTYTPPGRQARCAIEQPSVREPSRYRTLRRTWKRVASQPPLGLTPARCGTRRLLGPPRATLGHRRPVPDRRCGVHARGRRQARNGQSCVGVLRVGNFQTDFDTSRYCLSRAHRRLPARRRNRPNATWRVAMAHQHDAAATCALRARQQGRYVLRSPQAPSEVVRDVGRQRLPRQRLDADGDGFDGPEPPAATVSGYGGSTAAEGRRSRTRRRAFARPPLAEVIASPGTKMWLDRTTTSCGSSCKAVWPYRTRQALPPKSGCTAAQRGAARLQRS